jgi:hypothetical protein
VGNSSKASGIHEPSLFNKTFSMNFSIELVIARYEENLRWLRRVPEAVRLTIFNKGATPALPDKFPTKEGLLILPLANTGREAHSYLTHLVHRYNSLSPVTVFCQGHPFDHAPDFHDRLTALLEGSEQARPFLGYGFLEETDDPLGRHLFVPWSKNSERRELSTGLLYEKLFEKTSPDFFHFCGGAQFAVAREAILQRPIEFYQQALNLSTQIPDAAHSLERMWDRCFGKPVIDPSNLGANGVRYLKKIRRLETEAHP